MSTSSFKKAAILCTGTELTEGRINDSNGKFLAQVLTDRGFFISSITFLPDSEKIVSAIRELANGNDLLILTGGLGPTSDDLIRESVAQAVDVDLVFKDSVWAKICLKYGEKISSTNRVQAFFPLGFENIDNPSGSADGFYGMVSQTFLLALPGPPIEIAGMIEPTLKLIDQKFNLQNSEKESFLLLLISESKIETLLREWQSKLFIDEDVHTRPYWGTRAGYGWVVVNLRGGTRVQRLHYKQYVLDQVGPLLFADGEASLSDRVISKLRKNSLTLIGAESCTGGMVSSLLTEVSGSSEVFLGSIISYSNKIKQEVLKVQAKTLEQEGAVSESTVSQMLDGVVDLNLENKSVDCAFAISGIAGPTGGSEEKPVGTVFIGVYFRGEKRIKKFFFKGNRAQVRRKCASVVLMMINWAISDIKMLDSMANWEYSDLIGSVRIDCD